MSTCLSTQYNMHQTKYSQRPNKIHGEVGRAKDLSTPLYHQVPRSNSLITEFIDEDVACTHPRHSAQCTHLATRLSSITTITGQKTIGSETQSDLLTVGVKTLETR
jgi:hypothetical protein